MPRGLWFGAFPGDWGEAPRFLDDVPRDVHAIQIVLHQGSRVVTLKNAQDIDAFTETYGVATQTKRGRRIVDRIAWEAVAQRYDAIVIAPHCRERRDWPGTAWYYGWDAAAGCLWNPRAIAVIAHLRQAGGYP